MLIQPSSALPRATINAPATPSRQVLPAAPASPADTVSISQAARDLYLADVARSDPATSAGGDKRAGYDTNRGTQALNIETYFTPPGRDGIDLDAMPLLMPSQRNIDALSAFISAKMPEILAGHGIPSAPESVAVDDMGRIQLPNDYPYATEFERALKDNPAVERALRTTSALASTLAAMKASIAFQEEYSAATSQTEIGAVIARYRHLLGDSARYDSIALNFTADGILHVTQDGRSLAEA